MAALQRGPACCLKTARLLISEDSWCPLGRALGLPQTLGEETFQVSPSHTQEGRTSPNWGLRAREESRAKVPSKVKHSSSLLDSAKVGPPRAEARRTLSSQPLSGGRSAEAGQSERGAWTP